MESKEFLRKKEEIEIEIRNLRQKLLEKENHLQELIVNQNKHTLTNEEIVKYSRQIIVPSIGVKGQEKLKNASVLIVGCGGLGCPAAQYLTGSGVGRIGIVDYDTVEEHNLHRQLLHSEETVGCSKVQSMAEALSRLNGKVIIDRHYLRLNSDNAIQIISEYDLVIDASDNVATRYLVNDACVLTKRPLISGSAVRMEGQLTVYNFRGGPCYRCLFPLPPPPEAVSNCGDVGVLGPVPGVIGVLQALQAIHVILESGGDLSSKLLMFDGIDTSFRTIKLRSKNPNCSVCGERPTISKLIDYEQFCGAPAHDKNPNLKILKNSQRIEPKDLLSKMQKNVHLVLVDVRSPLEFEICSIPGSINIPIAELSSPITTLKLQDVLGDQTGKSPPVYVICRRGNDSQIGATKLASMFNEVEFFDLKGGLHAWAKEVDPTFPVY